MNGTDAATRAAEHLTELTGREAEAVVGLERADGRWKITLEALELSRVPNTTDVMAAYEVELDDDGGLMGCHRVRRYARGATDEEH